MIIDNSEKLGQPLRRYDSYLQSFYWAELILDTVSNVVASGIRFQGRRDIFLEY